MSNSVPSRSKSVSGASSGPPLIEGILEKKKTFGSSKYHCTLRDGKLWFSEGKGRDTFIDVTQAQSVLEGKARFSFEIITSSRTHTFVAESQAVRNNWISSLREAMRLTSRKKSSLSYIEAANSDEESGTSFSSAVNQRLSNVSSTHQMHAKDGSSLPADVITRTSSSSTSSSASSATKDQASELPSMASSSSQPEPVVVETDHQMNSAGQVMSECEQDKVGDESSKPDSGPGSDDDVSGSDNDRSSAVNATVKPGDGEIYSMSPNSLYVNDADIKKLLNECKTASPGGSTEGLVETEQGSEDEKVRHSESEQKASECMLEEPLEEDSEADDTFEPLDSSPGEKGKVTASVSPPLPVMRRPSQISVDLDVSLPVEPAKVELDADFCADPVPDLPHPCLEKSRSSAFAEIRAFLADLPGPKIEYSAFPGQPGRAVDSLKHFLSSIECR